MLKTLTALAAFTAAAALVVPTVSQAEEMPSVLVPYGDLNLASALGQSKLQNRIAFAAKSVCAIADPRDQNFSFAVSECRSTAIADAQPAYEQAIASTRHGTVTVLDSAALIVTAR